jgi:hypothetical protein
VADVVTELYVCACVLNRLDAMLRHHHGDGSELVLDLETGRYYLKTAARRIRRSLADLWSNDDGATTALAKRLLVGPARRAGP